MTGAIWTEADARRASARAAGGAFGPLRDQWRAAGLSVRAACALAEAGATTVEETRQIGKTSLMRIPNCGRVTVAEIGNFIGGWNAQ